MYMMDKRCNSSSDSTTTTTSSNTSNNRDQYLKQLNKSSHKISKPIIRKPTFDHHHHQPSLPPPLPSLQNQSQPSNLQQQQQHQPPVYNINKNDFRDVVQKLTGSPAHERFTTPPPIHPPKPQSSRLQRIRPPPLAQLSPRPPPALLNNAFPPQPPLNPTNPIVNSSTVTSGNFTGSQRQVQPLSPLPPFPAVHAAAESPISAYMRYLQSSTSAIDSYPKKFSGFSPLAPLISPHWSNFFQPHQQPPQPPPQQNIPLSPISASASQFPMTSSPLPFGCLTSPKSPYPLLSPSLLFSPTNQLAFQQFPLSSTVPVPSPRWNGH